MSRNVPSTIFQNLKIKILSFWLYFMNKCTQKKKKCCVHPKKICFAYKHNILIKFSTKLAYILLKQIHWYSLFSQYFFSYEFKFNFYLSFFSLLITNCNCSLNLRNLNKNGKKKKHNVKPNALIMNLKPKKLASNDHESSCTAG